MAEAKKIRSTQKDTEPQQFVTLFVALSRRKYQHITKAEADMLRVAFKNAVQIVKSLFGETAFKKFHAGTKTDAITKVV